MIPYTHENISCNSNSDVIFRIDDRGREYVTPHWHNSLEILYFTEGESEVLSDAHRVRCLPGDLAVINCTDIHHIRACTPESAYYCLIVDRAYAESCGIPVGELHFSLCVRGDRQAGQIIECLAEEMDRQQPYYESAARAQILLLLSLLARSHAAAADPAAQAHDRRVEMVRSGMRYIRDHFSEELSVDAVSRASGFSKFYFCRAFKEITGKTVIAYMNYIRCSHARQLIATGEYNVSESARRCGFSNLSYFTRTYKKYMGALPSDRSAGADAARR